MQLYNTISAKEQAELIRKAEKQRLTLSFYKYAHIGNPELFRNYLFCHWQELEILGRIYIAHEGVNAQLSLPADQLKNFKKFTNTISFLQNVRLNIAVEQNDFSFLKLTIKVRNKILADGLKDESFDVTKAGKHINAAEFNRLAENPEMIVVDMRNHYESEIGHFKGAVTPDVDTFRDSLPIIENQMKEAKETKNLVLYCTGGIRCEKASAYYMHKGFKNVFQLEGGIIEYVRQVKEQHLENKFQGKNFVFDQRRAERVGNEVIAKCHQCGAPCDSHTNCANEGCHLLFIQCSTCAASMQNCCSETCLEINLLPDEAKKNIRKRKHSGNRIFKKGRSEVLKYKTTPLPNKPLSYRKRIFTN